MVCQDKKQEADLLVSEVEKNSTNKRSKSIILKQLWMKKI